MIGAFLQIGVPADSNNEIVMGINELLTLSGDNLQYLLDVFHCYLVTGTGHGRMAVFLLVQQAEFALLIGHEYHLVIHYALSARNAIHETQQIHRHRGIVDFHVGEWTYERRQVDTIHINQRIHLCFAVTHENLLIIDFEASHRDGLASEILCKEPINEIRYLLARQKACIDTGITQLILYLSDLYEEVTPFPGIIGHQTALSVFLRDGEISSSIGIFTTFEVAEIAI